MDEKLMKKLQIGFVGEFGWRKVRDLLILQMREAHTEEQFTVVLKKLLASFFNNEEEINDTRKKFGLELLSEYEKNKMREFRGK